MHSVKNKNRGKNTSMYSSAKCENCGASFKPFNQYCEYCGSERPYEYPDFKYVDLDYEPFFCCTTTGTNYQNEYLSDKNMGKNYKK